MYSQIIGFYERSRTKDARRKPKTIQTIDKTRRVVRSLEFEMGHCVSSYLKKYRLSLSFIGLVSYKKNIRKQSCFKDKLMVAEPHIL